MQVSRRIEVRDHLLVTFVGSWRVNAETRPLVNGVGAALGDARHVWWCMAARVDLERPTVVGDGGSARASAHDRRDVGPDQSNETRENRRLDKVSVLYLVPPTRRRRYLRT